MPDRDINNAKRKIPQPIELEFEFGHNQVSNNENKGVG
jgi:hypothetical protein